MDILTIDDESIFRSACSAISNTGQYAFSGRKRTLQTRTTPAEPIDFVITDMGIPDIDRM